MGLKKLIDILFAPTELSFRKFLIFAIPALAVGLVLRLALLVAIPDGFFGADSNSYYEFSHRLFTRGFIHLNEKRRWLYPIFLAFVDWLPGPRSFFLVPLIQHFIGLLTVLGIGWCVAQLVDRPRIIVPIVTVLAAVWPRMLWYEHEFIAESFFLASYVLVIALLLTPKIVQSRYGLIALMLAFALLAGMKGASRFLWLGSVLGLFILYRNPRQWFWNKISLFFAALSVLLVSTVGKSSQGDWLALSSTLPLVRYEGEPYSRYRDLLKNQILEARSYGNDYPWAMKIYKKRFSSKSTDVIHPDWVELRRDKSLFSEVARSFWIEAVITEPIRFFRMTAKTIGIALSGSVINARLDPKVFRRTQKAQILERIDKDPNYFNRLSGVSQDSLEAQLASDRGPSNFLFLHSMRWIDQHMRWWGRQPLRKGDGPSGQFPALVPRPLGLTASLGVGISIFFSKKRLQCCILLLPTVLYLFGTYAVGDSVRRYLHPVDWVGFVFAGVFFDWCITFFSTLVNKCRLLKLAA